MASDIALITTKSNQAADSLVHLRVEQRNGLGVMAEEIRALNQKQLRTKGNDLDCFPLFNLIITTNNP